MSDWKKLRQLAEAATPGPWEVGAAGACNVVMFNGDDIVGITAAFAPENRSFIAAANPTAILALLDENDSLRAEVERLRMQHGVACSAAETMTGAFERSQQQLSAALAAKDEACGIAERLHAHKCPGYETGYCKFRDSMIRITALRTIGKDGGNG